MVSLVTDYVQNTAAHYLKIGLEAAGTVAGNAVGGVGGLIEDSGKAVANGVSGAVYGVGNYINTYGDSINGAMAPSSKRQMTTTSIDSGKLRKSAQSTPSAKQPGATIAPKQSQIIPQKTQQQRSQLKPTAPSKATTAPRQANVPVRKAIPASEKSSKKPALKSADGSKKVRISAASKPVKKTT